MLRRRRSFPRADGRWDRRPRSGRLRRCTSRARRCTISFCRRPATKPKTDPDPRLIQRRPGSGQSEGGAQGPSAAVARRRRRATRSAASGNESWIRRRLDLEARSRHHPPAREPVRGLRASARGQPAEQRRELGAPVGVRALELLEPGAGERRAAPCPRGPAHRPSGPRPRGSRIAISPKISPGGRIARASSPPATCREIRTRPWATA